MKYNVALLNSDAIFDQENFDTIEECKEWAKGRERYYNKFTNKFHKYRVQIHENTGNPLEPMIPIEEYHEE